MNLSSFFFPPAVAKAWPVDDVHNGDSDTNIHIVDEEEQREEVPEAAPTSTATPPSQRCRALPVCTAAAGASDGGDVRPNTAPRDIPRLAGLADYAMRLFLTE